MNSMLNMQVLNTIIIIGIVISAIAALIIDHVISCIIAVSVLGIFITLEFLMLKAFNVAIVEAVVCSILIPVVFIMTLKKLSKEGK